MLDRLYILLCRILKSNRSYERELTVIHLLVRLFVLNELATS
jgi:hypothetical protein